MGILIAIETTERFGSAALLDGSAVIAEQSLPHDKRSAATIVPVMDELFRQQGISPKTTEAVAVVVGPGSFTGLRVGVSVAKMFAYAVGAKIFIINTWETVAAAFLKETDPPQKLSIGVDAQRGDVAVQDFVLAERRYEPLADSALIPFAHWIERSDYSVFTGPALERFQNKMPPNVLVAAEEYWFPRASVAGLLAMDSQREPLTTQAALMSLAPLYSRLSAAEERFEAR